MGCRACENKAPPPAQIAPILEAIKEQRPCPMCGGPMESTVKQDRETSKEFKIWYCLNLVCDYRERID